MQAIYLEILKNLNLSKCHNILEYFRILKLTFNSDELIFGILQVSYSSYYAFNSRAKKGIILQGKVYKRLLKLYTYSKTGVWENDKITRNN